MSISDERNAWTIGSVNQEDFEKELENKANADLAQHENQLDQKRLEKTLAKRKQVDSKLSVLERKVANPRTLISQKELARQDIERIRSSELRSLIQDEADIRQRIRQRNKTDVSQAPDESKHDYLVRTGKITPFSKVNDEIGPEENDSDTEEEDDHRKLIKPAQEFSEQPGGEGDEDDEEYRLGSGSETEEEDFRAPVAPPAGPRDDGILAEYKLRLKRWETLQKNNGIDVKNQPAFTLDKSNGFKIPKSIWKRLFGYQKTGVRWLYELYTQKVGGIIGDEMGLGKTVQVCAFLAALHFCGQLKRPALIVCPATVLDQWVDELHQWWPPLRVAILHSIGTAMGGKRSDEGHSGSEDEESDLEDEEEEEVLSKSKQNARNLVNSIFETGHVIVTTYSGVKIYEKYLTSKTWGYCCLDEGHKIRNPDSEVSLACKQIKTPYRLILSGTPIQNNLTELWSLFDFIFPGRLGTLPVFQAQFSVPINVGGYANATNTQVQTAYKCAVVLRDMIAPYMLRRMKSDVASDLPEKTEKVLFCKLTKPQRKAYLSFLKSDELSSIMKGKRQVLFGVDILRKICNHPDLILQDTQSEDYGDPEKSGKMQVVKALLELWHAQGNRALLFSQTRQMLDILESFVRMLNLRYLRMDGSTPISHRQQLVDKYNRDESIDVFLLTTKVGGLGVNLTGANRVIIYDPDWNPSTDIQARERAWRLGQKKEVMIYRLMIAGSIEEKIYQRQIFKQFLTNKILKDPKQKRFFKNTDLHDLFKLGDGSESAEIFANESSISNRRNGRGTNGSGNDYQGGGTSESNAKRRKREPTDDLSKLAGVAKESEFESEETAKQKGNSDPASNEESNILEGIFAKAGVQSSLEHDAIVNASRPDTVLMEREAERIASQAAEALKESRKLTRKSDIGVPTWTGKSGLAGIIKKSDSGNRSTTSSKILQGLRQKRELETNSRSSIGIESQDLDKHTKLMQKIRAYLEAQPDKSASSADVVSNCNIPLDGPQDISNLRQIIKRVAVWQDKKWKLQSDIDAPNNSEN